MFLERRINDIKKECGYNNKQLEEKLNLSNGYINNIESGKNKNPSKVITALYEKLRISPNWIYSGEGSMFLTEQETLPETLPVKIPLLSQRVSCGSGVNWESEQNIVEYLDLNNLVPALKSKKLYGFRVSGTSMIGAGIKDTDIVIFSSEPDFTHKDGVYVFSLDGEVYCKRLEFDPIASRIKIYSVRVADLEKAELLATLTSTDAGFEERFRLFGKVWFWLHCDK